MVQRGKDDVPQGTQGKTIGGQGEAGCTVQCRWEIERSYMYVMARKNRLFGKFTFWI